MSQNGSRSSGQTVPGSRPQAPASAGMNSEEQIKFMYLFQRVNEALYLGPRGSDDTGYIYYDVPMDDKDPRKAMSMAIRKAMPPSPQKTISVGSAPEMPELKRIAAACPKDAIFSYFLPSHQEAVGVMKNILMDAPDRKDFLAYSVACRDSPMVNSQLWVHAMYSAALARPDMRGFRLPPLWEVMPDLFINGLARQVAQRESSLPDKTKSMVMLNQPESMQPPSNGVQPESTTTEKMPAAQIDLNDSFSGRGDNIENKLWYFREDIGIGSHHWHWHIIYSGQNDPGVRDRKGELFYYMHHGMVARYDAERLCNGLGRVRPLDVASGPVLDEGYFSKLSAENSGKKWGDRQEFTQLRDVFRENFLVDIEDIRKWKDRILEAIDSGFITVKNGHQMELTEKEGVDILGSLIENGGKSSLNDQYYGNLHNMGHVIISASHDPEHRHKENLGPMSAEATAVRDPVFFRWHKFIDNMFQKYKETLVPYPKDQLAWSRAKVASIEVTTDGIAKKNILSTHWTQSDIDLSRGLDLDRSSISKGPVWARFSHLNHKPFKYTITVNLDGTTNAKGTVRIFMAPAFNEQGEQYPLTQQRSLFFEMDKFSYTLKPGTNTITRLSTDSSVTIPWEQSFRDLEKAIGTFDDNTWKNAAAAVCGCGWPQHLLVPKGNAQGFKFDLFVMVSDGSVDEVRRIRPETTEGQSQSCKESISFCGLLNEKYPDSRAMGYPFDRKPPPGDVPGESYILKHFIGDNPNMQSVQVIVKHVNTTTIRPGGSEGKPNTTVVVPEPAVSSRNRRPLKETSSRQTRNYSSRDEREYDSSPDRFYN